MATARGFSFHCPTYGMVKFYKSPVWIDNDLMVNGHVVGQVRRQKYNGCVHWVAYIFDDLVAVGRPLVGGGSDLDELLIRVLALWAELFGGYCSE